MVKKSLKSNKQKKLKAVDPFYVGERKLLLDKSLIHANQAPRSGDDSKVPMKLKEYLQLNDKLKQSRQKLKEKHKTLNSKLEKQAAKEAINRPDERGADVPLRPVNKFIKSKHESEAQFLNRIEKHTASVINRSKYENQYEVKLETNEDKVIVTKEKKMSERKRKQLNKLKQKLKNKKTEKKIDLSSKFKDEVKFGEVVDAPPTITSLPRLPKNGLLKKTNLTIPIDRPGKNGVTEADRNVVIQRYRMMKNQGKFNS